MKRLAIILVCFVPLLVCSCEGVDDRTGNPAQPFFFKSLYEAMTGGEWLDIAEDASDYLIVGFDSGVSVDLPYSDVKVIDGNIFDQPQYTVENGKWLRNMVNTGFVYENVPDKDAYPLCVWYDSHCIKMYLSNGVVLARSCNPCSVMKSFSILCSDNPGLLANIDCTIDGQQIAGERPRFYDDLTFKPRFDCDTLKVAVKGELQVSGKTAQDFSRPVEYEVEMYDGSTVLFTVSLRPYGSFPAVYITTDGNRPVTDKVNYVSGKIRVDDPLKEHSSLLSFSSEMKIRGRGNSTWDFFPKKPYRIKLEEKHSVLGMPSDKDWILTPNYNDRSLLRNEVAFELSRICGFSWTPTFYPVEVYFNKQYIGLYEMGEHKEVSSNKVDINPDAGDVYLELECYPDEAYYFWTAMGVPLTYKDPEAPDEKLRKDVEGFFDCFENTLQSVSFADRYSGYAAYIDLKSFVDNYIIQELAKNYDGNLHKSTFFSKKHDGKLEFCHVWDFDLAFGNCSFFGGMAGGNGPEGFYVKDYGFQGYGWGWYYRLFQDPGFRKMVKDRWNELKPEFLKIPDFIDERAAYIEEAAGRNFSHWNMLNQNVWSQWYVPGTFRGEVTFLKNFYISRFNWLDKEINKW